MDICVPVLQNSPQKWHHNCYCTTSTEIHLKIISILQKQDFYNIETEITRESHKGIKTRSIHTADLFGQSIIDWRQDIRVKQVRVGPCFY